MLDTLEIQDIIGVILRKWWIVVICLILGGALAYTYTELFIDPIYVSTGSLYVNNKNASNINPSINNNNVNANDLSVALKLVDTYSVILKSDRFMRIVAEKVQEKIDVPYTFENIKSMVTLKGVNETEILQVRVVAKSPIHANIIAQIILENSKNEIIRVVEAGSVKIIDDASEPTNPSSPNKRVNTLIGMIIGFVIASGILLVIEFMDISVKDEEDLETNYGIPVVGSIPNLEEMFSDTTNKVNEGVVDGARTK